MPDYQKMYYAVCSGVSRVLDHMPDNDLFRETKKQLADVLLEAEEIYIETAEAPEVPDFPQEGVIFSAFYPSEEDTSEDHELASLLSEEERESCVKFYKRHMGQEWRVPNANALKQAPRFIALAKELSEAYRVDMDIAAEQHRIVVNIYLTESYYPSDFARITAQLINMCDYFTVWISRSCPGNVILSPVLYTQV